MVSGPLKSEKPYRTISIPAFLADELTNHLAAFSSDVQKGIGLER